MRNRFRLDWIMLVAGILVGAVGMWGLTSIRDLTSQGVTPRVVEGYSNGTNYDGTAIGISNEPGAPGEGYVIAGATWREFGGPWHDSGTPPSLAQPNTGQKVRLGIVDISPKSEAGGYPVVAWLEVLSN